MDTEIKNTRRVPQEFPVMTKTRALWRCCWSDDAEREDRVELSPGPCRRKEAANTNHPAVGDDDDGLGAGSFAGLLGAGSNARFKGARFKGECGSGRRSSARDPSKTLSSPAASPPQPLQRTPPRRGNRAVNPNLSAPARPRQLISSMRLSQYMPRATTHADDVHRQRRPRAITASGLLSRGGFANRGQRCYPVNCSHCGSQFFTHMPTRPILYPGERAMAGEEEEEEERRFCGKNCKLTAALNYRDKVAILALLTSPSSGASSDNDRLSGDGEYTYHSSDTSSLFLRERELESTLV